MIEAVKTIKSAPMGSNLADVTKSALYGLASLVTLVVKLTYVIIRQLFRAIKALVTK